MESTLRHFSHGLSDRVDVGAAHRALSRRRGSSRAFQEDLVGSERKRRPPVRAQLLAFALQFFLLARAAHADPAGTVHYPDFENIIPPTQFSIVQTPTGREFRYTHQIHNKGAGPLE